MKEKIIATATEMFLKLGFKSITMDDIAGEMCISKKTIYKYFINKEVLIAESTSIMNRTVKQIIEDTLTQNYNPIEENFRIREKFKGLFQSAETSPLYQLKKHYPKIYDNVTKKELEETFRYLRQNIEKGIAQGYYREGISIENYSRLFFMMTFSINENTQSEIEARALEVEALEYHIRAMATPKGIQELESQLSIFNTHQ